MKTLLRTAGSAIAIGAAILVVDSAQASGNPVDAALAARFFEPEAGVTPEPARRADINPYDRDIEITAPLQFNQRLLGDLPVLLTRDDRFIISSPEFLALIGPLLTPDAYAELEALFVDKPRFLPADIAPSGIRLDYDPEQLAVLVLKIAPEKRAVERLFQNSEPEVPGGPPVPFSAFLNVDAALSRYSETGKVEKPDIFLNGAVRYKGLVFEADFQARRDFLTDEYMVERRYARLVYDEPEKARRWYLGDLDPEARGRQGFINMGGVGVVRQRQRFNAFRSNVLSGGRRLVLQEQSTVRVMRNGIYQREFTLEPGQYDISNLPLDTGSNNIELEVQGITGVRETFNYQAYLDTIDLEPGDYEYGAYAGLLDDGGFGNPDYSRGIPVFTGFWRKAFFNMPAIGVGAQLSESVQSFSGQTQFILPNSGRVRVDAGVSNARRAGAGFAATVGYDQIIGGATGYDTISFIADYTSPRYATVGTATSINNISWNLNAAYTKRISENLFASANASYRISRSPLFKDAYSLSTVANYRFRKDFTLQFGVEYQKTGFSSSFSRGNGFGVSVGLVWQPRYNRRAEARYNTLRESGSVRIQQNSSNDVGSFGYSLAATRDDGSASVNGQVDYVANRFDATLAHSSFGSGLDRVRENSITTLRVGSSIAFAGGHVAVGRRINDSFALVYPHKTLKDHSVIVGEGLEGGQYIAKSGTFGPALQNAMTSYINQSVRYDVVDPPRGYDIGDGVKRVRPTYKSGYVIEVGSAAFVSAIGTLKGSNGEPVKLASGILRRADTPEAKGEPVFTNTVGRFSIAKLEPGVEYNVQFYSNDIGAFSFKVPEDNDGLLNLGVVEMSRKEGQ